METDILRADLERLFDLEELLSLSKNVLGFEPDELGGTAAKGSFANALTQHCIEVDAVEALCDALLASKPDVNPKVLTIRSNGLPFDEELRPGSTLGEYTIVRKLGDGRLGLTYLAKLGDKEIRVKVLRREATRDRRGLHRFLTVARLVGAINHPGLPKGTIAGLIGERYALAHQYVEGQPLAVRISRTGPMHINEARPLLRAMLEALAAIHERRLSHGDLRLENVIVFRTADGNQNLVLVDAGSDRLRARARVAVNGQNELFSTVGSPKSVAPELIRGVPSDPRSDVYSFGCVIYEILCGKSPFPTGTAIQAAIGHLTEAPAPPSSVAPRGWITKEIDDWVLGMLEKDPEKRPKTAGSLLEALETMGRTTVAKKESKLTDEELTQRVDALVADPSDEDAAVALEAAVEEGADATRVGEAFSVAADSIDVGDDKHKREAKKSLLFRAARLFEHSAKDLEKAEQMYVWLYELDPSDDIALTALEDVRKQLGKYEELIEMLLARTEKAESRTERARAYAEIGRLYFSELDDPEQALVAYTQAFCEDAHQTSYADEIERLAGSNSDRWNEVLSHCTQAGSTEDVPPESKNVMLVRMGRWYSEKLARPDLVPALLPDRDRHRPCERRGPRGDDADLSQGAAVAGAGDGARAARRCVGDSGASSGLPGGSRRHSRGSARRHRSRAGSVRAGPRRGSRSRARQRRLGAHLRTHWGLPGLRQAPRAARRSASRRRTSQGALPHRGRVRGPPQERGRGDPSARDRARRGSEEPGRAARPGSPVLQDGALPGPARESRAASAASRDPAPEDHVLGAHRGDPRRGVSRITRRPPRPGNRSCSSTALTTGPSRRSSATIAPSIAGRTSPRSTSDTSSS